MINVHFFFMSNFNQLFRNLIFVEIINLNFIDLSIRSSTTIFKNYVKNRLITTIFIFERFVFLDFFLSQVFSFDFFFKISFTSMNFFIEFVAMRIQQLFFIFYMFQISIENNDNFQTIIFDDSIFVKLNTKIAIEKTIDENEQNEIFSKKKIKRDKKKRFKRSKRTIYCSKND